MRILSVGKSCETEVVSSKYGAVWSNCSSTISECKTKSAFDQTLCIAYTYMTIRAGRLVLSYRNAIVVPRTLCNLFVVFGQHFSVHMILIIYTSCDSWFCVILFQNDMEFILIKLCKVCNDNDIYPHHIFNRYIVYRPCGALQSHQMYSLLVVGVLVI